MIIFFHTTYIQLFVKVQLKQILKIDLCKMNELDYCHLDLVFMRVFDRISIFGKNNLDITCAKNIFIKMTHLLYVSKQHSLEQRFLTETTVLATSVFKQDLTL